MCECSWPWTLRVLYGSTHNFFFIKCTVASSTASGFCLRGPRRTDYGTCTQGLRGTSGPQIPEVMAIFDWALKQVGKNGDVSAKLKESLAGLDSSKEIRNQIFYLLSRSSLSITSQTKFQLMLIFYFSEFSEPVLSVNTFWHFLIYWLIFYISHLHSWILRSWHLLVSVPA